MNCKEAISLIHDYLDQEVQGVSMLGLNEHLDHCAECNHHFKQLEKVDALTRNLTEPRAPEDLTERVVQAIMPQKSSKLWFQWVRRYPAFSVATVFLCVMLGSILILWDQGSELMVQGDDLEHIIIQGNKVIVPEGQTVHGNLIVENGQIQVDGEITGDLIVIDGSILTASTANISGKVTSINQAIDWFWYKTGEMLSGLSDK